MMNILTIHYCIEKCNTIFDNSLLKLFPPPLVHLVQCFPQPDDGIALAPAALFFVRHHAVADAADGFQNALGFSVHPVHQGAIVMHGLQPPMDGLVTGGALIHPWFPLLPRAAVGAHEQGVETVGDAVLVVVEATAVKQVAKS